MNTQIVKVTNIANSPDVFVKANSEVKTYIDSEGYQVLIDDPNEPLAYTCFGPYEEAFESLQRDHQAKKALRA